MFRLAYSITRYYANFSEFLNSYFVYMLCVGRVWVCLCVCVNLGVLRASPWNVQQYFSNLYKSLTYQLFIHVLILFILQTNIINVNGFSIILFWTSRWQLHALYMHACMCVCESMKNCKESIYKLISTRSFSTGYSASAFFFLFFALACTCFIDMNRSFTNYLSQLILNHYPRKLEKK